jgi:hypothetical protein
MFVRVELVGGCYIDAKGKKHSPGGIFFFLSPVRAITVAGACCVLRKC